MSTSAQTKANRANAKHSTGPTSAAGKQTCSQNSLKHGLSTGQLLVGHETEEEFNTLLTALLADHKPTTTTETMLVQDMAKHHWLADRALRMQNRAIEFESDPLPATLGVLIRYHTANERAYHKALAALNILRKMRLAEIGSASKTAAQAEKRSAAAEAAQEKAAYNEWHERFLKFIKPPLTIEQMIEQGFHENPETGNWEKEVPA